MAFFSRIGGRHRCDRYAIIIPGWLFCKHTSVFRGENTLVATKGRFIRNGRSSRADKLVHADHLMPIIASREIACILFSFFFLSRASSRDKNGNARLLANTLQQHGFFSDSRRLRGPLFFSGM